MVGINESSWHWRTFCFEIYSASFNPIWWFMLIFCFRLKFDLYLQNLSCAINFLSSWAESGWPPTLNLFPTDAQLKVGMIVSKNFLLWNFQCKFLSHYMIHACCFASDCFVPLPLWHPSVKSSLVQAALFVLSQLCVESNFCNLLFLTILFACAGYV